MAVKKLDFGGLKMKSTRYYSNLQEKQIAKALGGKQSSNSGATAFQKGDIKTSQWLIEAKTVISHKSSFSIKKAWLIKNKEEAFAMHRPYAALAFNFGPDEENYYVIDEKLFKELLKYVEEEK